MSVAAFNSQTRHFNKRIKQRVGIPKKGRDRFVKLALEKGYRTEDFEENSKVHNYLERICKNDGHFAVIYNDYVVIFVDNNIAVTILHLPDIISKELEKINKRRKLNE